MPTEAPFLPVAAPAVPAQRLGAADLNWATELLGVALADYPLWAYLWPTTPGISAA